MKTIHRTREELVTCLLPWQEQGLQETATRYGKKLTTGFKTRYNNRLYRVYECCFSNSGTLYIQSRGVDIVVNVS